MATAAGGVPQAAEAYRADGRSPDSGFIYAIWCEGFLKIGLAVDIEKRLATLAVGNPFRLLCPHRQPVWRSWMSRAENLCHVALAEFNHRDEWFKIDIGLARMVMGEAARRADRERQWEIENVTDPELRTGRGVKRWRASAMRSHG